MIYTSGLKVTGGINMCSPSSSAFLCAAAIQMAGLDVQKQLDTASQPVVSHTHFCPLTHTLASLYDTKPLYEPQGHVQHIISTTR